MMQAVVSILLFLFSGALALVTAQSVKPSVVVGDAASVAADKIVVTTKTGPFDVIVNDKSVFKKVSAEKPTDLAGATTAAVTDIVVGDKLTVTGIMAADGKSMPARNVYFIAKADIAAKNAKEAAEWQRRGITGKVTAVNSTTNQLTIETRTLAAAVSVVVTPKDGAKFLRYAPDSIRFDEAVPSTMAETKVGDMVRALGDRSSDGTAFSAEQLIAGAFVTVAGTVKSIDPARNEVVIKNLQDNKDVTVIVGDASVLKRFPQEQAELLARFQMMGAGGARPVGQGGTPGAMSGAGNPGRPAGGAPGGQPGGQGRPGGMGGGPRGGGVEDMLERSPTITIADLKAGDIIALSSTKTADTTRFKAIKLFAGVEPFLRSAQASGGGRRGQGGVDGGFSIPGLDP
jgi:hypothetical protein